MKLLTMNSGVLKGILVSVTVAFLIVGCGSPRIDGSSEEKMKSSIEKIQNSLSNEKREEFNKAFQVVVFSTIDYKSIFLLGEPDKEVNYKNTIKNAEMLLHNKTADEVIAEANKIRKDNIAKQESKEKKMKEQEREYALKEEKRLLKKQEELLNKINNLKNDKNEAEKNTEELKKIEIIKSEFYIEKDNKYSLYPQPIIDITVKNNTDKAIARIFATGTVKTEGREIPWIKEDFNYTINGGIEPGETYSTKLSPNIFSKWGESRVGENAIFTVEIVEIEGANKNIIASINELKEFDKELEFLNKELKFLNEEFDIIKDYLNK